MRGNADLKILPGFPEIDSTTLDDSISWSETLLRLSFERVTERRSHEEQQGNTAAPLRGSERLLTGFLERGIETRGSYLDLIFHANSSATPVCPLLRCADGARQGSDDGCSYHQAKEKLQLGNVDLDHCRHFLLLEVWSRQYADR